MPREDEFSVEWTFRSPLKTVVYPKGHKAILPADVQLAARKAGVLVPPVAKARRSKKKAG